MIPSADISYKQQSSFEDGYVALRKMEGRLLTDDQVKKLPYLSPREDQQKEWAWRARSASKLYRHLEKMKRHLHVLEVGCGNGWLAHYLSNLQDTGITGIDINSVELEQAERVFNKSNLHFIKGSFPTGISENKYDIIVFAASIQYFSSLSKVLWESMDLLHANGEIHIIDTHFYKEDEVSIARDRSRIYFDKIGFPDMIDCYHHHCVKELNEFNAVKQKNSDSLINKVFNRISFPWYTISKK